MNTDQRKKASGFTVAELLVVVLLVSLVLFISLSRLHFFKKGYARCELDNVYQACLYMHRQAMQFGRRCSIRFDVHNNAYLFGSRRYQFAQGVRFGILPEVKGPPSMPTKQLSSMCTFKGNRIDFSKDGTISAGTIYIIDASRENVYALSSSVGSCSYLRKYRYAGKWQLLD